MTKTLITAVSAPSINPFAEAPLLDVDFDDDEDAMEQAHDELAEIAAVEAELDIVDEAELRHSVVKGSYKAKYAQRAAEMARKPKDVPVKALKRSTSDWLAIELARLTLDPKTAKLNVSAFEAVLDLNGVKHAHWNRTTKGWQGRLRMTGRLALQRVVAEAGQLVIPGGSIPAPKSWVAKNTH